MIYLKLGFKKGQESARNYAPNATSIDAQDSNLVSLYKTSGHLSSTLGSPEDKNLLKFKALIDVFRYQLRVSNYEVHKYI